MLQSRTVALATLGCITAYAVTEYYYSNMGWLVAPLFFIVTQQHSNSFPFKMVAFFLLVFQVASAWMEKTFLSHCAFSLHAGMLLIVCSMSSPITIRQERQDLSPPATFAERVRLIYRLRNASKLADVPELLEKYKDREDMLLEKMEKKYGRVTPQLIEDELRQFYSVYNPSKLSEVSGILQRYKGNEGVLFDRLEKKYSNLTPGQGKKYASSKPGPEEASDAGPKVRLIYRLFNPSKLADVPELLEKYKDREDMLLEKMEKKYGRVTPQLIEDELRQFYSVYNPSKLSEVSGILQRYKGNEGVLFDRLEKKYSNSASTRQDVEGDADDDEEGEEEDDEEEVRVTKLLQVSIAKMESDLPAKALALTVEYKTGYPCKLLEESLNEQYYAELDTLCAAAAGGSYEDQLESAFEVACKGMRPLLNELYSGERGEALNAAVDTALADVDSRIFAYAKKIQTQPFTRSLASKLQEVIVADAQASLSGWDSDEATWDELTAHVSAHLAKRVSELEVFSNIPATACAAFDAELRRLQSFAVGCAGATAAAISGLERELDRIAQEVRQSARAAVPKRFESLDIGIVMVPIEKRISEGRTALMSQLAEEDDRESRGNRSNVFGGGGGGGAKVSHGEYTSPQPVRHKSEQVPPEDIYYSPVYSAHANDGHLRVNPIVQRAQDSATAAQEERRRQAVERALRRK